MYTHNILCFLARDFTRINNKSVRIVLKCYVLLLNSKSLIIIKI